MWKAGTEWRRRVRELAHEADGSPWHGADHEAISATSVEALPGELAPRFSEALSFDVTSTFEPDDRSAIQSFGAHFCEVEVDEAVGRAAVTRWVADLDCGRVINPKLARSRVMGGITFGVGMALLEQVPPTTPRRAS